MELTTIQNMIYTIRGERVMLDFDLAHLYQVETRTLKQAVRRNLDRFPEDFMFELLCNGIVEDLCNIFKQYSIPYGIGGFGKLYTGELPAEKILTEHYRLGSTAAILSRSFYNQKDEKDIEEIREIFNRGVKEIRDFESNIDTYNFNKNLDDIKRIVKQIVENNYVKS